jgi:hypothetical protein
MDNTELEIKIQEELVSGKYRLPFIGKKMRLNGQTSIVFSPPIKARVDGIQYYRERFKSLDEKDDFESSRYIERTNSLLNYIDSRLLPSYELQFQRIEGIDGKLPNFGGLDSLVFDNRIFIRPVLLQEIYQFNSKLTFGEVFLSHSDVEENQRNGELEIRGLEYPVNLHVNASEGGRQYVVGFNFPLFIKRYPIWYNINSKGIEKEARIPLEVLSNLLEPFTSKAIWYNINQRIKMYNNEMNDKDFSREELVYASKILKLNFEEIIDNAILLERVVLSALVKSWLLNQQKNNGLDSDGILSWNAFSEDREEYHEGIRKTMMDIRELSPRKIIRYFSGR